MKARKNLFLRIGILVVGLSAMIVIAFAVFFFRQQRQPKELSEEEIVSFRETHEQIEKALAQKAEIPAYRATKKHFRFRYIRTVVEGVKENAVDGFENWEFEDFILQEKEIRAYIASAWNALHFVPGERYLCLFTPFKSEEELELITDYSYYVTEDDHIVAALYDDAEEYTGYPIDYFEELIKERMEAYEGEKGR